MSRVTRVDRGLLSDSVYEQLQQLICRGVIKPGERLIEAQLADEFGTSQGPVREALRRLEENWMVERVPRRGTFVRTFTGQDMQDLLRIREAYDETVIRRAVPRISREHTDQMEDLVRSMQRSVDRRDVVSLVQADMGFHGVIRDATGSSLLRAMWPAVYGAFRLALTTLGDAPWEHRLGDADQHARILSAVKRLDVEGAVKANWEHMQHSIVLTAFPNDAGHQGARE